LFYDWYHLKVGPWTFKHIWSTYADMPISSQQININCVSIIWYPKKIPLTKLTCIISWFMHSPLRTSSGPHIHCKTFTFLSPLRVKLKSLISFPGWICLTQVPRAAISGLDFSTTHYCVGTVKHAVANMASCAISSSLILVILDSMIIGTNHIVLACLCRHFLGHKNARKPHAKVGKTRVKT
jgi:hypothetical protein